MNQNPILQILKAKKIISKVKKVEKIEYVVLAVRISYSKHFRN